MRIVGRVIAGVVAIGIIDIGLAYLAQSQKTAAGFARPRWPDAAARR